MKLAGMYDLYTALAAILQLAAASCRLQQAAVYVERKKHAVVYDLYTVRAAIRQPAPEPAPTCC